MNWSRLFFAFAVVSISSVSAFGQFMISGETREATLKVKIFVKQSAKFRYENFTVLLPRGELDDISKYGSRGQWAEMRELFQKLKPLRTPEGDSYRYYGIGMATEALAYADNSIQEYDDLINTARLYYAIAIAMNPSEPYFKEARNRVGAVTLVSDHRRHALAPGPVKKHEPPGDSRLPAVQIHRIPAVQIKRLPSPIVGTGAATQISNREVVELVRAGVREKYLVWLIHECPQPKFDLKVDGIRYLKQNKVANVVIEAMRQRQSHPTK